MAEKNVFREHYFEPSEPDLNRVIDGKVLAKTVNEAVIYTKGGLKGIKEGFPYVRLDIELPGGKIRLGFFQHHNLGDDDKQYLSDLNDKDLIFLKIIYDKPGAGETQLGFMKSTRAGLKEDNNWVDTWTNRVSVTLVMNEDELFKNNLEEFDKKFNKWIRRSSIEGVKMDYKRKRSVRATESTLIAKLKALDSSTENQGIPGVGDVTPLVAGRTVANEDLGIELDSVIANPKFKQVLEKEIEKGSTQIDLDGFDDEEEITLMLTEAIQTSLESFGIDLDDWDEFDSQESKVWKLAERIWKKISPSRQGSFEAMSTEGLESLQAVLANQLESFGSIQVIENIINSPNELTESFKEQITFIKNTADLSDTTEILTEILSAAETLLDNIQIELLTDDLETEFQEFEQEQEFDEYEEPDSWDQVDLPGEEVEGEVQTETTEGEEDFEFEEEV